MGLLISEHSTQCNWFKRVICRFGLWSCLFLLCLLPGSSPASSDYDRAIDNALDYLISQQTAGYWSEGDQALVDTVEVIKALLPHSGSTHSDVLDALNTSLAFIDALGETNHDVLARKFWVLAHTTIDASAIRSALLAAQNEDGGWGVGGKKQSNVVDTILVVDALLQDIGGIEGVLDDDLKAALPAARDFIIQQSSNGCWILADEYGAPSDVARTARALIALEDIANVKCATGTCFNNTPLQTTVKQAQNYLENKSDANGWFGTCADSALAYRALLRVKHASEVPDSAGQLLARQNDDGSWDDDVNDVDEVFTTALVLQALTAVSPPVLPDMADLVVDANYISFDPCNPDPNETVTINALVSNQGTVDANKFFVEFYNRSYGEQIGECNIADGVAAGDSVIASVDYNHSNDLFGPQRIDVLVDPNGDVPESTTANNFASRTLMFSGGKADLVINEVDGNEINFYTIDGNQLPRDPCAYEQIAIVAVVENVGADCANSFDVNFLDTSFSGLAHDFTVEPLVFGQKAIFTCYTWFADQGDHTIKVTADPNSAGEPNGAIHESNENNNFATRVISVGPGTYPGSLADLQISEDDIIISDINASPGDVITITATIDNGGSTASGAFHVLISNGSPYGEWYLVDSIFLSDGIAVGDSNTISVQYEVQFNPSGNEIFVLADSNGDVLEQDKNNNIASKKLNIPDLAELTTSADQIRFSHMDLAENQTVEVWAMVRNIGAVDACDVAVEFGLCYEGDSNYYPFGGATVPRIASNSAVDVGTIWWPDWQPSQDVNYTIYVWIDRNDDIPEPNNLNNLVKKDTTISNSTIPPSITLYDADGNEADPAIFGAYETVKIGVSLDPNIDANAVYLDVWVETPNEGWFWPGRDEGDPNLWTFGTGSMMVTEGNSSLYYEVKLEVYSLYSPFNLLDSASESFNIEEEIEISAVGIQTRDRFLRLQALSSLEPTIIVSSSSNTDVDVNIVVDMNDPNGDPVTTGWPDASNPHIQTLESGELFELPLGPYSGTTRPGTYTIYATVTYVDEEATEQTMTAKKLIPVLPDTGFDVFKSLTPEKVNPTDHEQVDVRINVTTPGVVFEEQKLDAVLIVDASGSMYNTGCIDSSCESKINAAKGAANVFAKGILQDWMTGNQVAVVKFGGSGYTVRDLTEEAYLTDLLNDINNIYGNYSSTRIPKGIAEANEILSGSPLDRRRVAVLISDGVSSGCIRCAANEALNNNITIFTVLITVDCEWWCETYGNSYPGDCMESCELQISTAIEDMNMIANITGGSFYRATPSTVRAVYEHIAEEISTTAVENVRLIDKVNRDPNDPNLILLNIGSITPQPTSIDVNESEWTIRWDLPSMEIGEWAWFSYEVDLYDLEPGEYRMVNKHLDVNAYNAEADELLHLEIGPQYVEVNDITVLDINVAEDQYLQGDPAQLTVTFQTPIDLEHALFSTQEDFDEGEANNVDTLTSPGNVILEMNDATLDYANSGTLTGLFVDAGSGSHWGNVDFVGGYQSPFFELTGNYLASNHVRDLYFYERETTGDPWWQDSTKSWYAEANDTIVDHALITDEGWVVSVPGTSRLDDKIDSNDFTIDGWISSDIEDANAVLFYRGDGDGNYLCIYKQDVGGTDTLFVDYNSATDSNSRFVGLSGGEDAWRYVALTVSDYNAKLYIDGNDVNDSWTYSENVMSVLAEMPIVIGGEPNSQDTDNFLAVPCRVDEVSIYSRALEANEIELNYKVWEDHLPSTVTDNLVGYWNFDPGPQDQSGTELGGMFTKAYPGYGISYGLRRITGRSSEPNFPLESYIVATTDSIDIIDARDDTLWMRFLLDRNFLWDTSSGNPSSVFALDGKIYVGEGDHAVGLAIIDFREDEIRTVRSDGAYRPYGLISENITSQGLVAHWKLDEGGGTTAYDSADNNDGTLAASPREPNWTSGYVAGALRFDDDSSEEDYVSIPTITALQGNTVTIAALIRGDDLSFENPILTQANSSWDGYVLYVDASKPSFLVDYYNAYVASSNSINTNEWYHIAGTYDGSYLKLYVNGVLEANDLIAGYSGVTHTAYIGYEQHRPNGFQGTIDEVRVYDRALSDTEVSDMYSYNALKLKDRFADFVNFELDAGTDVNLPDDYVYDVMAIKTADANYVAVGTRAGVRLIKDENDMYDSSNTGWADHVFLTDNNDLYFVSTGTSGDTLYAVYDILSSPTGPFDANANYGYGDASGPFLLSNKIKDLFVTAGTSTESAGDNTLYIATAKGLVQIQEDQGAKASGARKVYLPYRTGEPDDPDYVKRLAGDGNNVTAVYVDLDANELWVGTSDVHERVGALSIIDIPSDVLLEGLTRTSTPALPTGTVTSLDQGMVGLNSGFMALKRSLFGGEPVSIRARSVYANSWAGVSDPNVAVSEWTNWITDSGTSLTDPNIVDPTGGNQLENSRFLELQVLLTRASDPKITPVLEWISVGYTPARLAINVVIEDASGWEKPSIRFDQIQIEDQHMGQRNDFDETFSTDSLAPGDYSAVATLIDSTGAELRTAVDGFEVTEVPGPNVPIVTGSITVDKVRDAYAVGEDVIITSTVTTDVNYPIYGVKAKVAVSTPSKWKELAAYDHNIGYLENVRVIEDTFTISRDLTPEPNYWAILTVSRNNIEESNDSTTFDIENSCEELSIFQPERFDVNPDSITEGDANGVQFIYAMQNIGNVDLTDVNLIFEVYDINNPQQPSLIETVNNILIPVFNTGEVASDELSYSTMNLEPNEYAVELYVESLCSDQPLFLGSAFFEVVPGEPEPPNGTAPDYVIIDLGAIGDDNSYGHALNNYGHATGYADVDGNSHAFCWKCGEMLELEVLEQEHNSVGWGISDYEQIAGYYYTASTDANAYVWEDGNFIDLGTPDSYPVKAYGINIQGQVTGYYTLSSGETRAFVWHNPPNESPYWEDMNDWGLFDTNSVAFAISDYGDLAGYLQSEGIEGFISYKRDIRNVGQYLSKDTYLHDIQDINDPNEERVAAGYYDDDGTYRAVQYKQKSLTPLDSLGPGDSWAYGINAARDIVGISDGNAFLWRDGAINNLNNHFAFYRKDGGGGKDSNWWNLTDAYAINEEGQIVGFGTIDGNTHAFRLDPLPFPVTEPNLILWLRADTGVVKNASDPNLVAKWIDQTYSGHDLEQANANYQPEWVSDIPCCYPAIRFDGVNDYLSAAFTPDHDGNSTIFMAVATSSQETGTLFASEDGNTEPNAFEIEVADANLRLSTGTIPYTYDISTEATESVILEVVIDGNNVDFFKNGRLLNINGTAIGQNEAKKYTHCILGKNRDGDQFLDYDVAEVLVFAGALSDTHRQQVEDYLTSKHRLYGPANIEQPALWYKADAGVTMDGNDMVSKWADQSTSVPPHDATQDDPCRQPKWEDGIFECQPAILFDGSVIDTNTVYGSIDTYIVMDRSSSMDTSSDYADDPRRRIDFAKDAARVYAVLMLGGEPGPFLQDNGPNHIVSIEAEHFHDNITEGSDRSGHEWEDAWELDTSKNGYSGDGAMWAKDDDGDSYNCPTCYSKSPRLDFHVNFVQTGTHYVWVRGYADDSDSNCHAGLHKKPTPTADKIKFDTFGQYVWSNETIDGPNATFDVNVPGVNTVNIRMYDDGFRIDKIVLTTNPDYTPDGNGPAESARGESVSPTESGHRVGLIGFANDVTTFTFQPLTSDLNDIKDAINGLLTNRKTCYRTGIELMTAEFNDDANGSPEGQSRVCQFVTDGQNCCPDCDDADDNQVVLERVETAAENGITLNTVGVGKFVDPNHVGYVEARKEFLEDMAETGGGSSVTTPEPKELEAIFLELYYEIVEIFSKQTLSLVFKTEEDVSTRQVLWALGDPNNVGFNVYIDANELYLNAWSVEDGDGNGPETVWGPNHISTPVESNTPYLVDFVYDHTKSTIEGYLNGDYFDAVTGAGKLFPRESRIAIGNNPNQPTKFHDDTNDVNKPYSGYIAEILHYNKALSEQQRRDLDLYLSDKYGLGIRRNSPPAPNAPPDFTKEDNDWDGEADVNLLGDAYDDSNNLTYQWYENGVLIAEGKNPTVELSVGTHTIELWVTDEDGETSIDTFVVTVTGIPSTLDSGDLTAHWKFDQDPNDSSGNEFDANVVNAQEPNCWSGGKLGSAINLSADNNEYVDLNGDSNNVKYFPGGSHGRTIMGWFEAGDNPNPTFFDYGTADSNASGSRFAITASSTRLAVTIGSNSHIIGAENFYPLTGWHHIAVVFPDGAERSNQVRIFLDGVWQNTYTLDNSGPSVIVNTNTWDSAAYAYIGRDWEGNYFNGRIDDVRLYARALRDAEIPAVRAAQTRYRVIDLGMLEPTGNPQASEAWAISDQGDVVGRTTIYLEPNSPYYWRIDEKNKCEITEGDTWNFTTGSDLE